MDPETLLNLMFYMRDNYFILLASPKKQKKHTTLLNCKLRRGLARTLQQLRPITAGPVKIKGAGVKC